MLRLNRRKWCWEIHFLKILSGELDAQTGHVSLGKNERLAILKQDHFAYEEERVIDVVIKGHERLYQVMKEKMKFI